MRLSRGHGLLTIVIAAGAFTWFFSAQSIYMHWRFETRAFDLANYEQAFWNTLHGQPFRTTYLDGNTFLSNHFSPALLLPIACYAAAPRTETILVFQATSVALAALPLYGLVLQRLGDPLTATLLTLAYLMLPATELPLFYDYHDVSMLPLAVLTLLWALQTGRTRVALLAAALTATCKEEGALLAAGAVVFAIWEERLPRRYWLLVGSLVTYYTVVKAVVMPWFAGGRVVHSYYYEGVLSQRELAPAKLRHFARLFGPLLFLPLLSSRNLVMLATPLAIVFLATRWAVFDFTFQYNYYLLPFLFAGTLVTLSRRRSPTTRRGLAATILVLACLENRHYGPILQRDLTLIRFDEPMRYDFTAADADRYDRVLQVLHRIPATTAVAASETLGPHLARRETLYRSGEAPEEVDAYVVWAGEHVDAPAEKYERAFQSSDLVVWTRRDLGAAPWFESAPGRDLQFKVLSARQEWGELRLDVSVEGRPLSVGGSVHTHGYGTHAASEIRLRALKPAGSLSGAVGIDDEVGEPGSAVFVVKTAAGDELFRSNEMKSGMPTQAFHVSVTNLSEIVLQVERGADGSIDNAHADWLDLELNPN